ncbi:glycosyltransferase [Paenibacillus azoreducens]|uniref:tetratricopeptide repeat-containing glycosyltransferase family 2 protein n=1 Tax=Paenibacillus azoreducens TaxID=116718 RepID=UPI0039F641BE
MPPLDLTLCMIVKNEEEHLAKCLDSVRDLVSEIIIGDTGSTDQTMDIALAYGARVIPLKWNDDFAEARNKTLDQATRSWILVLDADEAADMWDADVVSKLLVSDERIAGYFVPLISFYGDFNEEDYFTDAVCRLFRNHPQIRFKGAIHENAADSVLELTRRPIPYAPLQIKHYGYLQSEIERKNKHRRNLELIESSLNKDPFNPQLRYALGTEFYQESKFNESLRHLMAVIEQNPASGYMSDVFLKAAFALNVTGQCELSEYVTDMGLASHPGFTDLLEFKGLLKAQKKDFEQAHEWMMKAAEQGKADPRYSSSSGCGTYRTHWLSGRICEKMLQTGRAAVHYMHALYLNPDYHPAWADALHLSLLEQNSGHFKEWIHTLQKPVSKKQQNLLVSAALNAGREDWLDVIAEMPDLGKTRQVWIEMMRQYAPQPGNSLYSELLKASARWPDDAIWISYLWVSAWKAGDIEAADRAAEQLKTIHSPLVPVHAFLSGQGNISLPEPVALTALQLFLQCRSYAQIHQLLKELYKQTSSAHPLPSSVIAGLLSAPAHVLTKWCLDWLPASPPPQRSPSLEEILLYTSFALRCSSSSCLDNALRLLEEYADNPYALAASAVCLTEKAKHRHSMSVMSGIQLPKLLRAATLRI